MFEIKGKYTSAVVHAEQLEDTCIAQITTVVNHPAFTNPIAIMPDAHAGAGAVIGFTMPLSTKIVPQVIGVDIGCGVLYCLLGPDALKGVKFSELDRSIREAIPFGFNIHDKPTIGRFSEYRLWDRANSYWKRFVAAHCKKFEGAVGMPSYSGEWFDAKIEQIRCPQDRAYKALGTLGGGNHFIEFCKNEENGDIWLVIHSGSRKFGESICKYWQKRAVAYQKELRQERRNAEIDRLKAEKQGSNISKHLEELKAKEPSQVKGLEWLETVEDRFGYMHDMLFAQQYAAFNRTQMFCDILDILGLGIHIYNECVHNFIDPDDLVIRKGAIRAAEGESCLVPLNMAAGSLLGIGKGEASWNCSAPHGAGRAMSRSQAKRELSIEDFKKQMEEAGVWSSSICPSTLDEAPEAYKDWHQIFDYVGDTMEVQTHLKPILNLKSK